MLFLDEVDTISGPAMVSFLSQLRAGYHDRPGRFPSSIGLVGLRDLRDYLAAAKGAPGNPGSPFNIKAASFTLGNFSRAEVGALYAQHVAETGQAITEEAADRAFWWTSGQPYLVNVLAWRCVMDDKVAPIDAERIERARERLVLDRVTHLDNLSQRVREERVARVLRPILLGDDLASIDTSSDDFQYAVDLGLVTRTPQGPAVASPWYREVIARQLTIGREESLGEPWWPWKTPDGRLDMAALVAAFQAWWRDHASGYHASGCL